MKVAIISIFLFVSLNASLGFENQIHFLMQQVKTNPCIFIKDDKYYKNADAVKHLQYKYNYLKSDISSAKEFIKKVATYGSNEPYVLHCKGEGMISLASWLEKKLSSYEEKK